METAGAGQLATSHDSDVPELAAALYEAAGYPDQWEQVLRKLCDLIASTAGCVAQFDFANSTDKVICSVGIDSEHLQRYQDAYTAQDIWNHEDGYEWASGDILTSRDPPANENLMHNPFFVEWMKPQGLFHGVCVVLEKDTSGVLCFIGYRPRSAGPFGKREATILHALQPHFLRAFNVFHNVSRLQMVRRAALQALNLLPQAVALVDREGKLLDCNQRAKDLLQQSDGITITGGEVRTMTLATTLALQSHIAEAATGNGGSTVGAHHQFMNIPQPSGLRPLSVLIAPLSPVEQAIERTDNGVGDNAVILVISDPEQREEPYQNLLNELYGLTPTETRLAMALAHGDPLSKVADRLGIRIGTARIHLKHIFSKTGTSRQAELVHLVLSGPTQLAMTAATQ